MKVIGTGLDRTGISSLKDALNILGFGPCYHMSEIYESVDDEKLWLEVCKSDNNENFNKIFKKYNYTVDNPSTYFYKRLIKIYPEAKKFKSKNFIVLFQQDSKEYVNYMIL